jgi:hypothetical protein
MSSSQLGQHFPVYSVEDRAAIRLLDPLFDANSGRVVKAEQLETPRQGPLPPLPAFRGSFRARHEAVVRFNEAVREIETLPGGTELVVFRLQQRHRHRLRTDASVKNVLWAVRRARQIRAPGVA